MKKSLIAFSVLALVGLGACGEDGVDGADGASGADGMAGAPGMDGSPGADGSDGANALDFQFRTDAPTAYAVVDRVGMPAINSAVITSKDSYNASTPADDAAGTFVTEITANVTALHDALDDDLAAAGLAACAPGDCVAQAAPLVVPDTLVIDRTSPAGFPNGRLLADPVMDVTLALVLLDLSDATGCAGGPCEVTTLANLPLNPPANDVPFLDFFPYVAPPF